METNREQLRNSLEYAHCQRSLRLSLVGLILLAVPTFLLLIFTKGKPGGDSSMAVCFIGSLVIVGLCFYNLHRLRQIFSHMEDYQIFTVTLTKPVVYHNRYSSSVSYEVTFPGPDGKYITRETARMFRNYDHPRIQDFNGHQVLVGYNETTDRFIVIGKVS